MTRKQGPQSQKPFPTPLAMSTTSAGAPHPSVTSMPTTSKATTSTQPPETDRRSGPTPSPIPSAPDSTSTSSIPTRPHPKPSHPTPKLHFAIHDVSHPGVQIFFDNANPTTIISSAISSVLSILYPTANEKHACPPPPVRSIKLILKPMDGVAYTTSNELDDEHKEIHFSLDYISKISPASPERRKDEILGVLVHEMVHVWQYNGKGTAPGGLIEGMADYVRLKEKLGPPHWRKRSDCDWDAGYERTAYFFDWLEDEFGCRKVREINERLRDHEYSEEEFWKGIFGVNVDELWKRYSKGLDDGSGKPDDNGLPSV